MQVVIFVVPLMVLGKQWHHSDMAIAFILFTLNRFFPVLRQLTEVLGCYHLLYTFYELLPYQIQKFSILLWGEVLVNWDDDILQDALAGDVLLAKSHQIFYFPI